jgi:hypothetical protein
MMIQTNRVLASLRNGTPLVSSVLLQHKARLSKLGQLAKRKALNYLKDLPLLAAVWWARYMLWREVRRRRRQT